MKNDFMFFFINGIGQKYVLSWQEYSKYCCVISDKSYDDASNRLGNDQFSSYKKSNKQGVGLVTKKYSTISKKYNANH